MPTYLYEDTKTGERFEVQQRISEPKLTWRDPEAQVMGFDEVPKGKHPLKRLIAGSPSFTLISGDSGGWASQGYSKPEHARKAEQTLGRKLRKPV